MRNFPNFLEAYLQYAKDDLAPDNYILWSGLSLIASALERKVWLVEDRKIMYPNLFVLLVGPPGGGKSITVGKARPIYNGLAAKVRGPQREFKIIEGIATQAGVCEAMETVTAEPDGSKYSSMYIIGAEGSDSALKNHADDFRSTACAMYDCEPIYQKTLKTKSYRIPNPVMNILAGTTYDFLQTIVDQNSVLGGLASRFTYVIGEKPVPAESKLGQAGKEVDYEAIKKLTEDLQYIYNLRGQFKFDPKAIALHKDWWSAYSKEVNECTSERLRSLLIRKPLLLKKVMMHFSVAERDDLGITEQHMEYAITAVDAATKDLTKVISSAMMGNRLSQDGLNQFIMQAIKKNNNKLSVRELKRKIIGYGGDIAKYDGTIKMLNEASMIELDGSNIKLLIDPDAYL